MSALNDTRAVRTIAHLCIAAGYVCLAAYGLQEWRYNSLRAAAIQLVRPALASPPEGAHVSRPDWSRRIADVGRDADQRWWSSSRIEQYRTALSTATPTPIAVLRIRELHLEVPVFGDTSDTSLNLGAGIIEGMAWPGRGGNLGIAGHRDGFFRALRNLASGQAVEVETPERTYVYRITRIHIVDGDDAGPLADTDDSSLTLVTCYPFFHLGAAPQRFVAQGNLERSLPSVIPRGVS